MSLIDLRYQASMTAIKLVQDSGYLNLTEEDFEFLTSNKPWIGVERTRARQVVEACVYGTLDYLGFPRFAVPAEFVAGAIAHFVNPVNVMTACVVMEGVEWAENIVAGVERPLKAAEIFAHTIRIKSGDVRDVEQFVSDTRRKLKGA
ncbi:MAG: hypothetical protein [Microviridae sp.]|nr:MAG: hypothetical protein [Microviridae sp.]